MSSQNKPRVMIVGPYADADEVNWREIRQTVIDSITNTAKKHPNGIEVVCENAPGAGLTCASAIDVAKKENGANIDLILWQDDESRKHADSKWDALSKKLSETVATVNHELSDRNHELSCAQLAAFSKCVIYAGSDEATKQQSLSQLRDPSEVAVCAAAARGVTVANISRETASLDILSLPKKSQDTFVHIENIPKEWIVTPSDTQGWKSNIISIDIPLDEEGKDIANFEIVCEDGTLFEQQDGTYVFDTNNPNIVTRITNDYESSRMISSQSEFVNLIGIIPEEYNIVCNINTEPTPHQIIATQIETQKNESIDNHAEETTEVSDVSNNAHQANAEQINDTNSDVEYQTNTTESIEQNDIPDTEPQKDNTATETVTSDDSLNNTESSQTDQEPKKQESTSEPKQNTFDTASIKLEPTINSEGVQCASSVTLITDDDVVTITSTDDERCSTMQPYESLIKPGVNTDALTSMLAQNLIKASQIDTDGAVRIILDLEGLTARALQNGDPDPTKSIEPKQKQQLHEQTITPQPNKNTNLMKEQNTPTTQNPQKTETEIDSI